MKTLCFAFAIALLPSCAARGGFTRSDCAADLQDRGYMSSHKNVSNEVNAEKVCTSSKPEDIAAAKKLVDEKYESSFERALGYVQDMTEPQLTCAKAEYDARRGEQGVVFQISERCRAAVPTPVATAPGAPAANDLLAVLSAMPELSTFVRMIGETGLTDTLKQPGPLTVFAPTNDALAKLPESWTGDNARMKGLLMRHIVRAKVELDPGRKKDLRVETIEGKRHFVSTKNGKLKVGLANITRPDVPADNGVIDVIDEVLP